MDFEPKCCLHKACCFCLDLQEHLLTNETSSVHLYIHKLNLPEYSDEKLEGKKQVCSSKATFINIWILSRDVLLGMLGMNPIRIKSLSRAKANLKEQHK